MTLQRLVLTFKPEELIVHALYRSSSGPGPGTKARQREVSDLCREGLRDALAALEGGRVDVVGTSGYTTREDVLCTTSREGASEIVHKNLKKGA
jgi:hypothetical protein